MREDQRGRRAGRQGAPFVTLVSAMLSSQTKDPITHAATARLVAHGCTPENIAATAEETLDALITPVGFHSRKAGYLRAAAKMCVEEHDGDIPSTVEGLMALPGVGPKMAYLVMNVGWEVASGICVDVHVHRIAERLGWVPSVATSKDGTPKKNRTPEDTRECLEGWLPRDEWIEINPLLVGHGQLTCTPRAPKCGECALSEGACVLRLRRGQVRDAGQGEEEALDGKMSSERREGRGYHPGRAWTRAGWVDDGWRGGAPQVAFFRRRDFRKKFRHEADDRARRPLPPN